MVSEDYDLYIVKRNDGTEIRLANFEHILRYLETGDKYRTEISIVGFSKEEASNELFQPYKIVWYSLLNPIIHEATQDDELAKEEYQKVLKVIDTLPDIDPTRKDSVGTLVKSIAGKSYTVVDGASRKIN